MILEFKKAFASAPSGVPVVVIKKSQIYGTNNIPYPGFLTNRSNHIYSQYPIDPDTSFHLNPGDQLTALNFSYSVEGNRVVGVMMKRPDGLIFQVFSTDLKRYIKII